MAYRDLRDFLSVLEQSGRLRRVTETVDPRWEIACVARWMFQGLREEDRFGLLFERVAGSDIPVLTGALGASAACYAIGLGAEPDDINDRWVEALRRPIAPRVVDAGVSQEIVLTGAEADLGRIPIPVWTPGKDAAPYISCPVVTRDRNGGTYNVAVYRTMVRDGRSVAVNLGPRRHGRRCCETFLQKGEPAPIAWVVGAEPVVPMAAVANVPYEVDELTIAGGLKGEPVELVPAKSIDLLVPASAEIVIEGEIRPGETAEEGPFGEFAGYMGGVARKLVATITAITHRRRPIYYGFLSQMPPSESTLLQSIGYAGTILKQLRHDLGQDSVADVYVDHTFGGQMAHGIVAMKPMFPGHAKQVGRLVADMTSLKRITVVDDDVDIRDPVHVAWAMNSRFSPARDTILIDDVFGLGTIDPTLRRRDGVPEMSSKIVCDATEDTDPGTFSLPSQELMGKALETWKKAGLPEFRTPKRLDLMLKRP